MTRIILGASGSDSDMGNESSGRSVKKRRKKYKERRELLEHFGVRDLREMAPKCESSYCSNMSSPDQDRALPPSKQMQSVKWKIV